MQAIITKYLSPTDTKGPRIKATCQRGSVTEPWAHEFTAEDNHRLAAVALCASFANQDFAKLGQDPVNNPWCRPFVSGCLPDSRYAHVFTT